MRWTEWRMLADRGGWYGEFDNDGPAVYELGIGGLRGGGIRSMYVGETGGEAGRMYRYGYDGSHLKDHIDRCLREGYCLYYRAIAMPSKRSAKETQDNLLARYDYPWNLQRNLDDDY